MRLRAWTTSPSLDEREVAAALGIPVGTVRPVCTPGGGHCDPVNGEFLGERVINPDGTLLTYSAVTVG